MLSHFGWIFEARACAPCIVFLDELDAVGPGAHSLFCSFDIFLKRIRRCGN